ncbi:NAD(P)-dependent oxidoreductase [Mycolicibacterium moriokaense]|nr:NAD(P)-dependent oxidoreductase [Mycolicibacterium moriokaense]
MGSEMLPHLRNAGFRVVAYDVNVDRMKSATTCGAVLAQSPSDVAGQSDVVLSLVMSADIPAAHFGADGILDGLRTGCVLAICSTTTPQLVHDIRAGAGSEAHLVDAPIIGGVRYAREKAITFLIGGTSEAAARAEPVLALLGHTERVGDFGAGVAYKLITNAFVMAAEAGLREALDLADLLGCDYQTALRLFAIGPMAPVVNRALDVSNPRPLRASAEDFDTLLSAVDDPAALQVSVAGRRRLWEAVNACRGYDPMFVDLTRRTTALAPYRTDPLG